MTFPDFDGDYAPYDRRFSIPTGMEIDPVPTDPKYAVRWVLFPTDEDGNPQGWSCPDDINAMMLSPGDFDSSPLHDDSAYTPLRDEAQERFIDHIDPDADPWQDATDWYGGLTILRAGESLLKWPPDLPVDLDTVRVENDLDTPDSTRYAEWRNTS